MASNIRLIAALDFGTHGTGFAWAFANERDREPQQRRINVWDDWAGQPTNYVKNLTSLLLDSSGDVVEWGYQALRTFRAESTRRPDLQYYERFKMALLDLDAAPAGSGRHRDADELITAYLREFYRFARGKILLGSRVAEDEIAWCVTVPAIWRDEQRDRMRACAEAAGFPRGRDRLLIAVEPEVAALCCRYDNEQAVVDEIGGRFMVVDAGGGTVDITAYEVAADGLSEIGYTSGGSHGSTYVDEYFVENVLRVRLGPEVLGRAETLEPGALIAMRDEWERAKRSFNPDRDEITGLPISFRLSKMLDDKARKRLADLQDGVDDEIVLTRDEMAAILDTTVRPILALIDDQFARIGRQGIGTILLVGGFAQSRYLQRELARHVGRRSRVIVPGRPSWAVLLGAVHYGLEPEKIVGRRSRFSYGVKVAQTFEAGIDPPAFKFFTSDGKERCNNRFDSFVEAGTVVAPGHTVHRTYLAVDTTQKDIMVTVYVAPSGSPRYVTDSGCTKLADLVIDISDTVGKPRNARSIEVTSTFGGTEIEVRAVNVNTRAAVTTTVSFQRKV